MKKPGFRSILEICRNQTISYIHKDFSAGRDAVLIWECFTQVLKDRHGFSVKRIAMKHDLPKHFLPGNLLFVPADSGPGLLQPVNGVGLKGRQNGPER